MTLAVLIFQIGIFVTMFFATLFGRGGLKVATLLWVMFTLFGSIYTMGLMALQLITIYFSYKTCIRFWLWQHAPAARPRGTQSPSQELTFENGEWVRKP